LQPSGTRTVQGVVEEALIRVTGLTRKEMNLTCSGRTDTGVHAHAQTINVYCPPHSVVSSRGTRSFQDLDKLQYRLNALLPVDVRVVDIMRVPPDFSAQFTATAKTYTYRLTCGRTQSPFYRAYAYHCYLPLEWNRVQDAARVFEEEHQGVHNFFHFSNTPPSGEERNPVRRILRCRVTPWEVAQRQQGRRGGGGGGGMGERGKENMFMTGEYVIELEATGFLYRQARHMVGAIIAVGAGKMDINALRERLRVGDSIRRGELAPLWRVAPAHGLYLHHVQYPPLPPPPQSDDDDDDEEEEGNYLLYPSLPHRSDGTIDGELTSQSAVVEALIKAHITAGR